MRVKPFKYPKGYIIGWVYKSYEDYFNDIRSPVDQTFDRETCDDSTRKERDPKENKRNT